MQEGKTNETQLDVTDRENQNLYFFPSQKSSSYFCKQILKKNEGKKLTNVIKTYTQVQNRSYKK